MDKIFTQEDYLRITNEEEELLSRFPELPVGKSQLEPSKKTVNNILNFSKALSVRKSKCTGYVEVVLN